MYDGLKLPYSSLLNMLKIGEMLSLSAHFYSTYAEIENTERKSADEYWKK